MHHCSTNLLMQFADEQFVTATEEFLNTYSYFMTSELLLQKLSDWYVIDLKEMRNDFFFSSSITFPLL